MIELAKAISPILEGFKNIVGYGSQWAAMQQSNIRIY
jgi:hypothetical protein